MGIFQKIGPGDGENRPNKAKHVGFEPGHMRPPLMSYGPVSQNEKISCF